MKRRTEGNHIPGIIRTPRLIQKKLFEFLSSIPAEKHLKPCVKAFLSTFNIDIGLGPEERDDMATHRFDCLGDNAQETISPQTIVWVLAIYVAFFFPFSADRLAKGLE